MASAHRTPNIIFLTGAPSQDDLGSEQLITELQPPIERFVKGQVGTLQPNPTNPDSWPKWRLLNTNAHDEKRISIENGLQFAFLSFASQHDHDEVNYDFLEHSLTDFARDAQDGDGDTECSFDRTTVISDSFASDFTEDSSHSPVKSRPLRIPTSITNLKDLPKAHVLEKAYPQTFTVDLIVGIISVSPPRTIKMRESGRSVQLVEVIVGDETKTNVSVSFWIQPPNAKVNADTDRFRQQVSALRPQQVVLMTTVSLRVWQGRVYGQSLSVTRERKVGTRIERLDVWAGNGKSPAKLPGLLQKKRKNVKGWIMDFAHSRNQKHTVDNPPLEKAAFKGLAEESQLPPDTPE